MRPYTIATAALLAATSAMGQSGTATTGVEEPSAVPTLGAAVVQGCFSSQGQLSLNSTQTFNSKSKCALDICAAMGKAVAGTMGGNQCFCGDEYPPKSNVVNDSNCNIGCTGFPQQACGGDFFWTIYNTGVTLAVKYSPDSVSSSASSTVPSSTTSSSSTAPATTTTSSAVTSTAASGSGGSSKQTAGIAAGVVVAVVAVAAIAGGTFFALRRRRNREIEEEHRRNAAVNAFINGSKPPSSSGGYSLPDARMDPVMAQRRVSNGSIADNEDYSRRILRVTNA